MSRIAVVTSSPPMSDGGHMVIARSLVQALRDAGHQADVIVTPQNRFGRQASEYLATWLTDVGVTHAGPIDQVISLRYPSFAVRHPRHVCWLNHTMREYYDLWDRFRAGLGLRGRVKEHVRRTLIQAGRSAAADAQRRPPVRAVEDHPEAARDVAVAAQHGALSAGAAAAVPLRPLWRLHLHGVAAHAAEAHRPASCAPWRILRPRDLKAVIAGDGEERDRIEALIAELGVADRVTLAGSASPAQLVQYLANCRAVCFPPFDEDYGFVTVEAFVSQKAVVTCTDSGGPAELVEHGVNGFVCDPTPEALALRFRELMDDAALAERLGQNAYARGSQLTWPDTVKTAHRVELGSLARVHGHATARACRQSVTCCGRQSPDGAPAPRRGRCARTRRPLLGIEVRPAGRLRQARRAAAHRRRHRLLPRRSESALLRVSDAVSLRPRGRVLPVLRPLDAGRLGAGQRRVRGQLQGELRPVLPGGQGHRCGARWSDRRARPRDRPPALRRQRRPARGAVHGGRVPARPRLALRDHRRADGVLRHGRDAGDRPRALLPARLRCTARGRARRLCDGRQVQRGDSRPADGDRGGDPRLAVARGTGGGCCARRTSSGWRPDAS